MNDYYGDGRKAVGCVSLIAAIVVVIIGVVFFSSCVSTYNSLVEAQEDVSLAEADVETMMQRRLELIPDLVEVVKSYAAHEEAVYDAIAEARAELSQSLDSGDVEAISEANENLSIAINSLIAIAEDYPELTSGEQYTALMDQLEGSVNRITVAREEYNDKVSAYNKKIRKFPGMILANLFGFEKMETFSADEAASNTNLVDFGEDE